MLLVRRVISSRTADRRQAPKTNINPVRLASIVTYLQQSRTAHTIKDLEKQLPSVASISGMQVKGTERA